MPELLRFFGIVIRMFTEIGGPHHPIVRIRAFEFAGPYALRASFDDDSTRVIDFEPVLAGALYGPLRAPELFRAVRIDPEAHTLVWPNGADFDPATLLGWPAHADAFARRAREWRGAAD